MCQYVWLKKSDECKMISQEKQYTVVILGTIPVWYTSHRFSCDACPVKRLYPKVLEYITICVIMATIGRYKYIRIDDNLHYICTLICSISTPCMYGIRIIATNII